MQKAETIQGEKFLDVLKKIESMTSSQQRFIHEMLSMVDLLSLSPLLQSTNKNYWRHGMTTSEPKAGERVNDVRVTEDAISVDLFDGRTITVPLTWYPRLLHATPEQRAN